MTFTVRSARSDDEAAIIELWRASYNDPAGDFRFARGGANSEVLVGEDDDGRLCASAMVGHDGHRGWLYYVAVDPGCRSLAHGSRMVKAGEAWLRARAIVKVQLMIRETNTGVIAFYKSLGFDVTPRTVMAKWLTLPR